MCEAPEDPLIAIVDDEECARNALERLMRAAGYRVATHSSGAEFLESLQRCRPACIVTDLVMPGINGFDVLAALNDEPSHIPAIVITGDLTPATLTQALALGTIACLSKPYEAAALLGAVTAALQPKIS